ncbi:MAG: N-acetylmuramoyl-L-alanine amidase [Candidatus Schekmanbacteria bacterium]|nr:N-acetylmuramoyl-L-alanine amidase [Candidatus Schekmanbacteria bacterium]
MNIRFEKKKLITLSVASILPLIIWTTGCSFFGEKKVDISKLAKVTMIRNFSGSGYSRVAIDMDKEARYEIHRINNPKRIFIDVFDSYLTSDLNKKSVNVSDGVIKTVRASYYKPTTVRIVMDVENFDNYTSFVLKEPYRVVIDLFGQIMAKPDDNAPPITADNQPVTPPPSEPKTLSLSRQLGLGVHTVAIDAGHGGKDPGAIGVNGLREKDVVLDIALRLKKYLTEQYGMKVLMTRADDVFIPLEERTAMANANNADLFISIHANASRNLNASGIETYYLNLTSDPAAMETAARENSASMKNISDLQKILSQLLVSTKIKESTSLASSIQKALPKSLAVKYSDVKDLGVKKAPFYVLIGARMPSILVETSFITNPSEGIKLAKPEYREALAKGILEGISKYIGDFPQQKKAETVKESSSR